MALHSGSDAADAGLRTLLASLLLSDPIHIDATLLSDDVHMRHRMLGLARTQPYAADLEDTMSDGSDSQAAFIRWLCRDPIEVHHAPLDIDATARSLFVQRRRALDTATEGERDPIDLARLTMLCKNEWHGTGRFVVRFPGDADSAMLHASVVRDGTYIKLDNLFALDETPTGMHRHTPSCWDSYRSADDDETPAAAEYINDADEFWDGFDDPAPEPSAAPTHSTATMVEAVDTSTDDNAEVAAIRDIVRGAYTLFRSRHGDNTNNSDAFLDLVRNAIAPQ